MVGNLLVAVPAMTLLLAGGAHLRSPRRLAEEVREQAVLPDWSIGALVVALPLAEVLVGGSLLWVLAGGSSPNGNRIPLAVGVVLYIAIAGYATYVWKTVSARGGVPVRCGCSSVGARMTEWVVIRAAVLTASMAGAFVYVSVPGQMSLIQSVVFVLASVTFTTLLWIIPGALQSSGNRAHGGSDVVHG